MLLAVSSFKYNLMSKLVILLALIALSLTLEGVVELTDANFK